MAAAALGIALPVGYGRVATAATVSAHGRGGAAISGVVPLTAVNVGGGTWNYGSGYSFPASKKCWSDFFQPYVRHSATAIVGSHTLTKYAVGGRWARATVYGSLFRTCRVYWDNL